MNLKQSWLVCQPACSCFVLWTMCALSLHNSCVNRFVTMKQFSCKWFRVTQYCGLWRSSTWLLVFVSTIMSSVLWDWPSGGYVSACHTRMLCWYCFFTHRLLIYFPSETFSMLTGDLSQHRQASSACVLSVQRLQFTIHIIYSILSINLYLL